MPKFVQRKRKNIELVLAALLILSACASYGQPPVSTTTPVEAPPFHGSIYEGNIQRTGVYNGGGGPNFGLRSWTYTAEYDPYFHYMVADDLAFVTKKHIGLQAIDTQTGKVKYIINTGDSHGSLPTVADGVLYYGATDGLHARDIATGRDNWVFNMSGYGISGYGGAGESPAIYDGVVYFGGAIDPEGLNAGGGYLFAVDAKTGQEKWRFAGGSVSFPAIGDGMVFFLGGESVWHADVIDFHGILYALDLQTGKEVWHAEPKSTKDEDGSFGDPVYYNGLVYSATSFDAYLGPGYVYAFDARTGKEVWKQTTADDLWNPKTPVIYNGLLYVSARASNYPKQVDKAPLYVFDAASGEPRWVFKGGWYMGAPAISNGILYISTTDDTARRGTLYSLDPETGHEFDRMEFEIGLARDIQIAGGAIYAQGFSQDQAEDFLIAVQTLPATGATPAPSVTSTPAAKALP